MKYTLDMHLLLIPGQKHYKYVFFLPFVLFKALVNNIIVYLFAYCGKLSLLNLPKGYPMPSPIISAELRRAWSDLSNSDIQKKLESFGLTVELKNSKSRHFKVSGSIRPVELYASTGTVNAAPFGKLGSSLARGMYPDRALSRVQSLAKIGH
jgi:hypothetical protein